MFSSRQPSDVNDSLMKLFKAHSAMLWSTGLDQALTSLVGKKSEL
jgi:hypothetical protein